MAVPSLDSWSARVMRERWMELKLERLFYFDSATIQSLLFKSGFEHVELDWVESHEPRYVIQHFRRFPVRLLSPVARLAGALMPPAVGRQPVKLSSGA
jgi:hypothetical protein